MFSIALGLLGFHVVAEEVVLIPEIKPASEDDRVGPGVQLASFRLIKPAPLLVSLGAGFDERDRSLFPLAADDETAVRVGDGAFADAPVLPDDLAGLELEALQGTVVGAVD